MVTERILPSASALIALSRGPSDRRGDLADAILASLQTPLDFRVLRSEFEATGWDISDTEIAALVDSLIASGQIGILGDLLDRPGVPPAPRAESGPRPRFYGWPTRRMSSELTLSIGRWTEILGELGDLPQLLVVADSEEPAGQATIGSGIVYRNRENRASFAQRFPDFLRPSVMFALGFDNGPVDVLGAYGANRNYLLLLGAGQPFVSIDDDMVPDFRLPPGHAEGVGLLAVGDLGYLRPFGRLDHLMNGGRVPDTQPLRTIEKLLGRGTSTLLSTARTIDASRADATLIAGVLDPRSRVAAVCVPSLGVSGSRGAGYLVSHRDVLDGFPEDESSYRAMMESRLLFRAPLRTLIGKSSFMAGCAAYDARELLPPFSPWGRNEDGLWGAMVSRFDRRALVAYPPMAVLHSPHDPGTGKRTSVVNWRVGLNDAVQLVVSYLSDVELSGGDWGYEELGEQILSLCLGDRHSLDRLLWDLFVSVLRGRQGMLVDALNRYEHEPSWWADDVNDSILWMTRMIEDRDSWFRDGLLGNSVRVEDYLVAFGRLLGNWPEIYAIAQGLDGIGR